MSGREGVSFQFYSVNRLVHSRDTEALERKSKVLPGEMALEQRLEGGAVLIPGGRVFQVQGRTSAKALRQETAVSGVGGVVERGPGW